MKLSSGEELGSVNRLKRPNKFQMMATFGNLLLSHENGQKRTIKMLLIVDAPPLFSPSLTYKNSYDYHNVQYSYVHHNSRSYLSLMLYCFVLDFVDFV